MEIKIISYCFFFCHATGLDRPTKIRGMVKDLL